MNCINKYYTYAYLREDGTPYYIGKGSGNRATKRKKCELSRPGDESRIIFLKQNLTEEEAFKHEIYMISVFGRKDLGTGILHNRTNGGDGVSGRKWSDEDRLKKSIAMMGDKNHFYKQTHTKEIREILRNMQLGRTWSDEDRLKKSIAMMGDKNHFYGKKHNNNNLAKMSQVKLKYTYKVISPENEIFITSNLTSFCKENGLHNACMNKIAHKQKRHKTHRGWKCEILGPSNCDYNVSITKNH
jgi:hypothetical protein